MAEIEKKPLFPNSLITQRSELVLSAAILGTLVVLLVPLPTVLLDMLLAFNLGLTILLMLVTLSATQALDFSVFPSVGLNFVLNCALIWPLREAGLAWSTSASAIVQTLVLGTLCRRLLDGPMLDRDTAPAILRIAAAAAIMGAGVYGLSSVLPVATTWTGHAMALASLCTAGGFLYLALAAVLHCHELGWLVRRH